MEICSNLIPICQSCHKVQFLYFRVQIWHHSIRIDCNFTPPTWKSKYDTNLSKLLQFYPSHLKVQIWQQFVKIVRKITAPDKFLWKVTSSKEKVQIWCRCDTFLWNVTSSVGIVQIWCRCDKFLWNDTSSRGKVQIWCR